MNDPRPGVLPRNTAEPADPALDRIMSGQARADTDDIGIDEPDAATTMLATVAGLVNFGVAIGVGIASGYLLVSWFGGLKGSFDGAGALGAFAFIAIIAAGALGMAVFSAIARGISKALGYPATAGGSGALLVIDLVGIAFIYMAMVVPVHHKERVATQQQFEREAVIPARRRAEFLAWAGDIRGSGAHAPPGVVPPMLRVEDDGVSALVTNTSGSGMNLGLSRVLPGAEAGTWRHCRMGVAQRLDGVSESPGYYEAAVPEGATFRWVPDRSCTEEFRGAPLEYRVGRYGTKWNVWWSDSALDTEPQWLFR